MEVVIVGSGFGAVKLAVEMSIRQTGSVTLVSDSQRLMSSEAVRAVASGRDLEQVATPMEEILKHHPRVKLVHDSLVEIDAKTKKIACIKKTYKYDTLVLAMEQVSQFTGANPQKQCSYATDSLEVARLFQEDFHDMLVESSRKKLHCAIVGGGKTGAELAGALIDYSYKIEQAHQLKANLCKVSLIETSSSILSGESFSAQRKVKSQLKHSDVKLYLRTDVNKSSRDKFVLRNRAVAVDVTVRTDMLMNHPIFKKHPSLFKVDETGKVIVNHYLSAHPDIYILGVSAQTKHSDNQAIALHDAGYLAKHLTRILNDKVLKPRIEPREVLFCVRFSHSWAYVEYGGVYVAGWLGAIVESLVELNRYCQLMPYRQAVRCWRNSRINVSKCQLCTGT